MKKIYLLFYLSFFVTIFAKAQSLNPEIVAPAGGYFQGANASLSWTLGEPVTETSIGNNAILTQGFQQDYYTIVSVYENPKLKINVSVYPNPAVDFVNISIENNSQQLDIALTDINGKLLVDKKTNSAKSQISLKQYQASVYFLSVKTEKGEIIKSFKIVKSDK